MTDLYIFNKFGDCLGSIFSYSSKELYLMTEYKECVIGSLCNGNLGEVIKC